MVYGYTGKEDLSWALGIQKENWRSITSFRRKKSHTLLCILKFFELVFAVIISDLLFPQS